MNNAEQSLSDVLSNLPEGGTLTVGAADGDHRVQAAGVDRIHARFSRRGGTLSVRDLDSSSGTFRNGEEVRGIVELHAGDVVQFGDFRVVIPAARDGTTSRHDGRGFALTVAEAVKTVLTRDPSGQKSRRILDCVSFHVDTGQFVGVLGASGSGKSSLMKAIAGIITLSQGEVRLNGQVFTAARLEGERGIAYLPQDVVVHERLSPRVALGYVAILKEIGTSPVERQAAIGDVLERVGLADRSDVPIFRLSGGQRKRVALAAELLGDPGLILLDEATSGLDPATEGEMMQLFGSLSKEGRTVICITHFPGRLHTCDRLLYLMQGKPVFFGPPSELLQFFQISSIEDAYVRERESSADAWAARFSAECAGRIKPVRDQPPQSSVAGVELPKSTLGAVDVQRELNQARHLTERYARLLLADARNLLLLVAQAPIIALMVAIAFGGVRSDFVELHAANTKEVIFVLALSVLWCSGTASVREIVKEFTVLRHEARFGVGLLPYLLSKFSLLGMISLLQTLLLLLIVRHFTLLSGGFLPQFVALGATGLVGVAVGLCVSATAGSSERAMTLLPVILIGQAIFSGGLARIEGVVRWVAMAVDPAWWALDGLRSTFSTSLLHATYPGAPGHYQPPILGPGGPLFLDTGALLMQMFVILSISLVVLARRLSRPILRSKRN